MRFRKSRMLAICALVTGTVWLGVCPGLMAQGDGTKGRKVWIMATKIPKDIDNPVLVRLGNEVEEYMLQKRFLRDSLDVPESGIVQLVKKRPGVDLPPEEQYEVLSHAVIPEGMQRSMIILVPDKREDAELAFMSNVQNLAGFKGGDNMYVNLSPRVIRVSLNQKNVIIKPGKIGRFVAPKLDKPQNAPIAYFYRDKEDKDWSLISASTVVMRGTRREIVIFYMNPRTGRFDYHGVTFPVEPK